MSRLRDVGFLVGGLVVGGLFGVPGGFYGRPYVLNESDSQNAKYEIGNINGDGHIDLCLIDYNSRKIVCSVDFNGDGAQDVSEYQNGIAKFTFGNDLPTRIIPASEKEKEYFENLLDEQTYFSGRYITGFLSTLKKD